VQIELKDVDADIARARASEHRVEIRAVAVHQASALMHESGDLRHRAFVQAERVRVGDHQPATSSDA
jgi:hypothetical protein